MRIETNNYWCGNNGSLHKAIFTVHIHLVSASAVSKTFWTTTCYLTALQSTLSPILVVCLRLDCYKKSEKDAKYTNSSR